MIDSQVSISLGRMFSRFVDDILPCLVRQVNRVSRLQTRNGWDTYRVRYGSRRV